MQRPMPDGCVNIRGTVCESADKQLFEAILDNENTYCINSFHQYQTPQKISRLNKSHKAARLRIIPVKCWKFWGQQRRHCETLANSSCLPECLCGWGQQPCFYIDKQRSDKRLILNQDNHMLCHCIQYVFTDYHKMYEIHYRTIVIYGPTSWPF